MNEYDETQLFPDMRLARILLERLGKNSLSVSVEVAAEKILDAQHTIADQAAEITRLLAVEAAAKKLDEALEWVMKDYEGMCRKGYQQSANWKKRVVMAKASSKAFQRSINPIGDKRE